MLTMSAIDFTLCRTLIVVHTSRIVYLLAKNKSKVGNSMHIECLQRFDVERDWAIRQIWCVFYVLIEYVWMLRWCNLLINMSSGVHLSLRDLWITNKWRIHRAQRQKHMSLLNGHNLKILPHYSQRVRIIFGLSYLFKH